MRETAINFPTTLSAEEKHLKEMFEKLKNIRKAIASATRTNPNTAGGDALKIEKKNAKRSLQEAEEATEEVKRKVMSGAINLKKANEKCTFKRSKILEKRRESESKLKLDTSDTGNSSGNEMLSPTSTSFHSPPFSSSFEAEKPKVNRGPTLYIRGYDLMSDSLNKAFEKYGKVTRIFVEDRQKSAFITFTTTEQAEEAMKEMDGNMVNGITLRVSFARRQNQNGPPPMRGNQGGALLRRGGGGGAGNGGGGGRTASEGNPAELSRSDIHLSSPANPRPAPQPVATPPVQLAWSQATSRKSKESKESTAEVNSTALRQPTESRSLVSYAEDEPFA